MSLSHVKPGWLAKNLLAWYDKAGRHDLPWKNPMTPYRVWISEIMLQQTQVATVIPYFERFMQAFPDVATLAQASLDHVLHHWAGLGYYARGRNLHKTAQILQEKYQGKLPECSERLQTLPGIGRSTAGAIVAQAFDQRALILDGNVKRVLCRFHCIDGWPGESAVEEKLWQLTDWHTPKQRLADYTQAIMDLGATLCTRSQPQCHTCPLQTKCLAYANQTQLKYPFKPRKKALPVKHTNMLLLVNARGELLLQQRPVKGIWGGLWSLPEFDDALALKAFVRDTLQVKRAKLDPLAQIKHTFTHYHLFIEPKLLVLSGKSPCLQEYHLLWFNQRAISKLGLPAPVQKLISQELLTKSHG